MAQQAALQEVVGISRENGQQQRRRHSSSLFFPWNFDGTRMPILFQRTGFLPMTTNWTVSHWP
jgi:hypothetical protein